MAPAAHFEAEIHEQPAVWRALAVSAKASEVGAAIGDRDVVIVGSGSSLYVAQLAALAFRRTGIRATALAASEAPFDCLTYRRSLVIALSQSGRSADLLSALDVLDPAAVVTITNDARSPLAERSTMCIALDAGIEAAVPATKTVTATAAILLWVAARRDAGDDVCARELERTSVLVERWLSAGTADVEWAASAMAALERVAVLGAGLGSAVAGEIALKIKEASYLHAEAFSAGEFRHGSAAMLDAKSAVVGIVDATSRDRIERALREAIPSHSERFAIGAPVSDARSLGPSADGMFAALAWVVTGQMLALRLGRERGVDSDAPRGLTKIVR